MRRRITTLNVDLSVIVFLKLLFYWRIEDGVGTVHVAIVLS